MAELNQVFIFNKDMHNVLPIEEGKQSIYGVRPSYMYNEQQKIFQRDTENTKQQSNISKMAGDLLEGAKTKGSVIGQ